MRSAGYGARESATGRPEGGSSANPAGSGGAPRGVPADPHAPGGFPPGHGPTPGTPGRPTGAPGTGGPPSDGGAPHGWGAGGTDPGAGARGAGTEAGGTGGARAGGHGADPAGPATAPTRPIGAASPAGGGHDVPPAGERPGTPDGTGSGAGATDRTENADAADSLSARARSLLVPVADPSERPDAAPSVAPVLPGRPVDDRPQVRAPGWEQGAVDGPPCPWCATPNRADRHFCARCAMPMAGEESVPGPRPWWRRLLEGRRHETPWAGDRPRLRRTFDRILSWLVAAVVLTLLILAGVNAPKAVQATRDHFAQRAPVAPDRVLASRSYPGHKPQLAFDKLNNTWWGPGVTQSGQGQWIEARFDEPTRLLDVVVTPGVSTRPDQLTRSALPHRITATITAADGTKSTRELTLDQGAGGQRRAFRVGTVTAVRFTVDSAYMASSTKQVAIAEIEFFGPSNASAS
ncbi:NADase-type glycan-binding domain-containing protein [Streptomyces tropicalis]|uniref:NADase-type glycan-binding domain-containing protein n=1 Tax=Streptomyces tropicalis TaxID=3034234 RepID=UPI003F68B056